MILVLQLGVLAVLLGIVVLVCRNHRLYRIPPLPHSPSHPRLVSILVPARDEAENISACVGGLAVQDYPRLEVIVLDDCSTDGTARLAAEAGAGTNRVRVITGRPLAPGWAGKGHACHQLAEAAAGDWLLFVDADTRQARDLVSRAVAWAEAEELDLLSSFPRQEIGSLGEALTVPSMYWLVFTLLPHALIPDARYPAAVAACGQFILVRAETYRACGGHDALRTSLHDGLHMARMLKSRGYRVGIADLSQSLSCRMYRNWWECWAGFTRNAYQGVGSIGSLCLLTAIEAGLFLGPFLWLGAAVAVGWPAWGWPVLLQAGVLLGIQIYLRHRFRYPWWCVVLHPLGIAVWIVIQWTSWFQRLRGAVPVWRGRPAPAE